MEINRQIELSLAEKAKIALEVAATKNLEKSIVSADDARIEYLAYGRVVSVLRDITMEFLEENITGLPLDIANFKLKEYFHLFEVKANEYAKQRKYLSEDIDHYFESKSTGEL